ncbi:MAG: TRAP transporter small permease [Rhodospirillaceae bacterium]|jgi:TRAP-type C4-dicarboxylate transport system permease small subunit|nr:TRAP transporter small permease [Rhodospirillaceae bacterium]MBT5666200.1 TRAP transporter small permease [Rhodospirillaceae bacterium]MBT5810447.1 TRAP transporter small permease [Rhodospirillaceae bacterium]
MEVAIDRLYRVVRFITDKIIGNGAAFVMLAATILAIIEIFRRYILGVVFDWGQDAVTYMMVSAVFLYFAVTQAQRSNLAMLALIDMLRKRGYIKLVLTIRAMITLLSIYLFASFSSWGIPTVERTALMGRKTQSLVLELWPFQLCLTIGFGLMALICLFQLYQDIQAIRGKTVFPWAPVDEHIEI